MPKTALAHFRGDISRSRAILDHAISVPNDSVSEKLLRSDLFRSAWMFAIGALDAYFCDAYTDVIASTLASKSRQPAIALPEFFYDIRLPIRTIMEEYSRANWRWRMAARKMMERENVLSLQTIQELFNKFFLEDRRFFKPSVLDGWICHHEANTRLFKVRGADFQAMSKRAKEAARREARQQMEERFKILIQRRHDCIHNCDRPRVSPQTLNSGDAVLKVIEDVAFFVLRCEEHINEEFRHFLQSLGCSAATIAAAGY